MTIDLDSEWACWSLRRSGIGVILTFLFGAVPRVFTSEFRLLVRFEDAEGISADTPGAAAGRRNPAE